MAPKKPAAAPAPVDPVLQNLNNARTGIGEQVNQALGEIGRRETQAQTSTAGYAPTLANIYAGLGDDANSPSLKILRASQEATTPLVNMGFTDMFARQRGGLEQARLLEMAALDKQQATYEAQRAEQQRQIQAQRDLAAQEQAARAAEAQRDRDARASENSPETAYLRRKGEHMADKEFKVGNFADPNTEARGKLSSYGDQVSAEKGSLLGLLGEGDQIRQRPAYQWLAGEFAKRVGNKKMSEQQMADTLLDITKGRDLDWELSMFMLDRGIDTGDDGELMAAFGQRSAAPPKKKGGGLLSFLPFVD